jgi:hypothetical protein
MSYTKEMKPLNIIGLAVFTVGTLLLIGFGIYEIIEDINTNIPIVIILGVAGVILGVIIMLISLIIERVKDNERGE